MPTRRLEVLLRQLASGHNPSPPVGPIIVVGGAVLDIQAQPNGPADLQRGSSVPGKVRYVPGGVGRNIAEALSMLVPPALPRPMLASLLGKDTSGRLILSTLQALRLDLSLVAVQEGMDTPCVVVAIDKSGEVSACVADVEALERCLTPQLVTHLLTSPAQCSSSQQPHLAVLQAPDNTGSVAQPRQNTPPQGMGTERPLHHSTPSHTHHSKQHQGSLHSSQTHATGPSLQQGYGLQPGSLQCADSAPARHTRAASAGPIHAASLLVVEANLSEAAIGAACSAAAAAGVPVFFEPVSVPKSVRCLSVLHQLAFIKPNAAELMAIAIAVLQQQQQQGHPQWQLQGQSETSGCCCSEHAQEGRRCSLASSSSGSSGAQAGSCCSRACSTSTPGSKGLPAVKDCLGSRACSASCNCGQGQGGTAPASGQLPDALLALLPYAAVLLNSGVQHVVLTMGAQGAALLSSEQPLRQCQAHTALQSSSKPGRCLHMNVAHMPALPATVVSLSGAGDSLVAGMAAAIVQGKAPFEALAYGMAAAKQAVQSESNVSSSLSFELLRADAGKALLDMQRSVITCMPVKVFPEAPCHDPVR